MLTGERTGNATLQECVDATLSDFPGLRRRLNAILAAGARDVTDLEAALETWFDDTMERLQGACKRSATTLL